MGHLAIMTRNFKYSLEFIIVFMCYLRVEVGSQACNGPLLQTYNPVLSFVNRILANSQTTVLGPDSLPLLNEQSYFVGESPNNVTTVIELNAPTPDLQGSFWLTAIAIIQRPMNSVASMYSCAAAAPNDLQLFQLQYSKDGIWHELEYDNAPLGLYSFEGVTAKEEAEIRVAVIPTVVDSVKISKFYPGISRFCFQFELYGCEATSQLTHPDVLQYNMPTPSAESKTTNSYTFSDHKYSGVCDNVICTGGVGLLTDGYIESSTYTAYSAFTGWDGSSSYSIQLYLHSIYTINRMFIYGSQWFALPVDSKAPNYITVNGARFRVRTFAAANEADFSYFGTGVYYISVPVVTTASLLDITFECDSYYSLLLSEIELIAESGLGTVQLSEQIYYANGTIIPLEQSTIYIPNNQTGNQSSNQTFPTLPLAKSTNLVTNSPLINSTLFPRLELIYVVIPFAIVTLVLSITVVVLLVISVVLCCMVRFYRHSTKEIVLPALTTNPVVENVHYSPSDNQVFHFASNPINPLPEQRAYESIASFEAPAASNGDLPATRYSNVMKDYTHLKSQLTPTHAPPPFLPNSHYTGFPVPNPLFSKSKSKRDSN